MGAKQSRPTCTQENRAVQAYQDMIETKND